jgi:tripartite-type tricarboxylate transporter receptor subunit TctC
MKLPRREFLHLAAGAAAMPFVSRSGWAQTYPNKPVRIVVGFAAGGSTDILARLIGQWLSERLSQQFIIENRPGAGTTIATESVVRSLPDGYTLLLVNSSDTTNAALYPKLNYNFIRDIAPVGSMTRQPQVMLVNPSLPAKTFREFIAYAKSNPGKITMASPGNGGIGHLSGELLKIMAGVDLVHVPYRGAGPALTDLLAGHVQISFAGTAGSIGYLRTGKLRALAVTTTARSKALPDVPTISEFVAGYEAISLFGIGAPKNTPAEVVDTLNKEINAALADPKTEARVADLGGTVLAGSPAEFGKLLSDETEKWAKVIRTANIKPE